MNHNQNYTYFVSSLNEEEFLLQQMAADDREAFNTLYKYFQPKVQLYIFPFTQNTNIDAEEIVQDIFVKMWFKRKAFIGITSLEPYLYRMARNRLIDLKRSLIIQTQHVQNYQEQNIIEANATADDVQFREFKNIALQAINSLPVRRRKIFELRMDKDLSIKEIADVLQISKAVVKKQLYLATTHVRNFIQNKTLLLFFFILLITLFKY